LLVVPTDPRDDIGLAQATSIPLPEPHSGLSNIPSAEGAFRSS